MNRSSPRPHTGDNSMALLGDVLCIDDDEVVQILLKEVVWQAGARYHGARSARQAQQLLGGQRFDLVLLDRRLPDADGLLLIEKILKRNKCPVIVLSQMGDPQDRQLGLGLGASEYLAKPFNPNELSSRIRGLLERNLRAHQRALNQQVELGSLRLTASSGKLQIGDEVQYLPPAEARMLHLMLLHRGEVLDRDDLTLAACGRAWSPGDRTADVLIARLRKKIPTRVASITTVHRCGYVLDGPSSTIPSRRPASSIA